LNEHQSISPPFSHLHNILVVHAVSRLHVVSISEGLDENIHDVLAVGLVAEDLYQVALLVEEVFCWDLVDNHLEFLSLHLQVLL
jgi:hypothetical protein